MKNQIKKFLQFNGRNIVFLSIDGQYWVALKPICEALNLDWSRQMKNLKNDPILRDVRAVQPLHDSKNRLQNMIALPEMYVYGWLFSIKSSSDVLQQYKKECYELLYNHFHGTITQRIKLLEDRSIMKQDINALEKKLNEYPEYKELKQLQTSLQLNGKALKKADNQKEKQLTLELNEELC